MNFNNLETMSLPVLLDALAERTGMNKATADAFISAVTETITSALRNDHIVKIKGLGTFKTDSTDNISFVADPTIAAEINAPFSIFEPIEIDGSELPNDDMSDTDEETSVITEQSAVDPINEPIGTESEVNIIIEDEKECVPLDLEPEDNKLSENAETPTTEGTEENFITQPVEETAIDKTEDISNSEIGKEEDAPTPLFIQTETPEPQVVKVIVYEHPWLTGILAGLAGILLGFVACYFAYPYLNPRSAKNIEVAGENITITQIASQQEREIDDTIDAEEGIKETSNTSVRQAQTTSNTKPQASTAVIYDTIRPNRFLTTMAREHYGRKIFWVYIYEENKAKITDPDNIAANTAVVIPPAEKYGIKAGDKQSEEAAERKAIEILGHNR